MSGWDVPGGMYIGVGGISMRPVAVQPVGDQSEV